MGLASFIIDLCILVCVAVNCAIGIFNYSLNKKGKK